MESIALKKNYMEQESEELLSRMESDEKLDASPDADPRLVLPDSSAENATNMVSRSKRKEFITAHRWNLRK